MLISGIDLMSIYSGAGVWKERRGNYPVVRAWYRGYVGGKFVVGYVRSDEHVNEMWKGNGDVDAEG